jgi:Reverse transcriptase (RNA-dependent DNA polymerase)/zinc-binding in reverse transcriptase
MRYLLDSMLVCGFLTLLIGFTDGVKCQFCNNDFVSVKRHEWRCKARCTSTATDLHAAAQEIASNHSISASILPEQSASVGTTDSETTCVCGRKCVGRRGLKAHERSCAVLKSIMKRSADQDTQQASSGSADTADYQPTAAGDDQRQPVIPPTFTVKPGLKLPKTDDQWTEANLYFKLRFASYLFKPIADLNSDVLNIQNEVYNYFANTWGTLHAAEDSDFATKYKDWSARSLKKSLKLLKKYSNVHNDNTDEIKYVSALIRTKLTATRIINHGIVYDSFLSRNLNTRFWKTCQNIFNAFDKVLPSFDVLTCYNYFVNIVAQLDKFRSFVMPTWIPKLPCPSPSIDWDSCPTYEQVATAVNRCKPNASACPFDQLSIITLKRCPILRTMLHHIISSCWAQRTIPNCWKIGGTILIYKKGNTDDPENYRPITLQPVWYKIFSSVFSTKIYNFVSKNNLLDKKIQKGFCKGIDGVSEHTETLAHLLRDAKHAQRSLTVVLLDLRNAFGSVHHELIRESLKYHHLPNSFLEIFNSIYSNSFISIAVNKKWTDPVRVDRGVLQGDPSSPILFNLCFNSLMVTLKQPEYINLGYYTKSTNNSVARSWLQFADDAAIVASSVKNAQCLLNLFQAWCHWSGLEVRHDKCAAFAMLKRDNKYQQILPALNVCSKSIPQVPLGGEFRYLGRIFNFECKSQSMQKHVSDKLSNMLSKTASLKISVQLKLRIFSQYIQSQMISDLKIYDFTQTWVEQTLDSMCISYIRDWLELPISACVAEVLILPKNQGGFGISSFKLLSQKMRLIKRHALWTSPDKELRLIASDTAQANCKVDEFIAANADVSKAKKAQKESVVQEATKHLINLQCQGATFKEIHASISKSNISTWSKVLETLTASRLIFARKAISQVLPTASNLVRWKRSTDPSCHLCSSGVPQTNKHVLSNCSSEVALLRYTKRHDDVLRIIVAWIKLVLPIGYKLHADLNCVDCMPISDLFQNCRPDIAVCMQNEIVVLELTVCHETNLTKSRDYKTAKYRDLSNMRTANVSQSQVSLFTCEVSTLGFISDISQFCKACKLAKFPADIKKSITKSAISNSYSIYCNRNNADLNTND